MKKILSYIIIFLISSNVLMAQSTTLDNSGGLLNNLGTIKVKQGQVNALPDTLGGRIEFLAKYKQTQQKIPNIVYNQLVLRNKAKKFIKLNNKNPTKNRDFTKII